MSPAYKPIVLSTVMSQYGYWLVTYSVAPGLRVAVMICTIGITQQQAEDDGLASLTASKVVKG